jgi:hypothetical protein
MILFFISFCFAASPELQRLRLQTKDILLTKHCFNCHSPEGKRPLAKAMKIYDLSKDNWYTMMTDRQLNEFKRRILEKMSPEEIGAMGGDLKETPLSKRERQVIKRFVEMELANRKAKPLERALGQ